MHWLGSIAELTSIDLQRTSWLDTENQNPHWSFSEFMCSYFDDFGCDDYGYRLAEGYLSAEEFETIRPWHELLDKYDSPNDEDWNDAKVLEDPKWLAIVSSGEVIRRRLEALLGPTELKFLNEALIYPGPSKWP